MLNLAKDLFALSIITNERNLSTIRVLAPETRARIEKAIEDNELGVSFGRCGAFSTRTEAEAWEAALLFSEGEGLDGYEIERWCGEYYVKMPKWYGGKGGYVCVPDEETEEPWIETKEDAADFWVSSMKNGDFE